MAEGAVVSGSVLSAAYVGEKWSPRAAAMSVDMVSVWGDLGVSSEIGRLHAVLQKRPGPSLDADTDFEALPINFSAVSPGEIVMPRGNHMREKYEAAGVHCRGVGVAEFIKAGGGIHCMTEFLKRDAF